MNLIFNEEEIKIFIKKYYHDIEGIPVQVIIDVKKNWGDDDWKEKAIVTIKVQGKTEIMGRTIPFEQILTQDELTMIFTEILKTIDFDVTSCSIDAGLTDKIEGSGYNEHLVKIEYFKGIIVTGMKKSKEKTHQYSLR